MPLGKSLGNLLGDYFGDEAITLNQLEPDQNIQFDEHTQMVRVPIESIKLNPFQTRTQFDFEKIQTLAQSIKQNGLIHPIVVLRRTQTVIENEPATAPTYMLLAGERRLRATKILEWSHIWAVVKDEANLSSAQQAMITAMENLQREDLSPIELARTFEMLMKTQGINEEQLAQTMGNSTQHIKNYLRLLTLSLPVQQALLDRVIGEGQARHLVGLPETRQIDVLSVIIEKSLTVKEIIELLKKEAGTPTPIPVSKNLPHNLNPEVITRAQKLAEQFPKSKLKCTGDDKKGKIVISWG
jgi:ParB family chromosome partitioning protein